VAPPGNQNLALQQAAYGSWKALFFGKMLEVVSGVPHLSHAKISRGFVKNRLKITSETKEWQKIILKPYIIW
jgi:hypothetical protein